MVVNEGVEFRDEIDYSDDKKISMQEIVLRHIKKISDICCKEFTGGYWEKKPIRTPNGIMFSQVYHNDVREAYCNAIDFLMDIVYSASDETLQEYLDENEGFGDTGNGQKNKEMDIKDKIKLKRETFRQINEMFARTNFFKGSESYNE